MAYHVEQIGTPDGRILEVAALGPSSGVPVVFHHGSPGSCAAALDFAGVAERRDLRILTIARAGYGHSSPRPRRSVASVVEDVATVRAHFGVEEYVAAGRSGGGPHALACAALDPACRGAISLAGVAPTDVDFDWTEGMAPENVEEFTLVREDGPAFVAYAEELGRRFADATADTVVDLFGDLLSDVDRASVGGPVERELVAREAREAFAVSVAGFIDDYRAFFSPWGFDLAAISVPVEVWYGDEDLMVPRTHGDWLSRTIPTATSVHHPLDGHLTIVSAHLEEFAASVTRLWSSP